LRGAGTRGGISACNLESSGPADIGAAGTGCCGVSVTTASDLADDTETPLARGHANLKEASSKAGSGRCGGCCTSMWYSWAGFCGGGGCLRLGRRGLEKFSMDIISPFLRRGEVGVQGFTGE
jgi:hypothetical protein